jgi:hypothetical protein
MHIGTPIHDVLMAASNLELPMRNSGHRHQQSCVAAYQHCNHRFGGDITGGYGCHTISKSSSAGHA